MNTNELNSILQKASDFITQLQALPNPLLVAITCIVIGYILKRWNFFPNQAIPVVVVIWGALFTLLLSGNCPAGLTAGQWRIKNALVGLVMGFAAWAFHYYALSRLEDRFPWLKRFLCGDSDETPTPTGPGAPAAPPPQSTTPTK
jgi:hypothetical protein